MRRWRGVTLIEMLVAMGVAAVLTVSLAGVLRPFRLAGFATPGALG
ncbi:MAG: prepilin-type N-terminal cleavage/methylation domain-containing protein [Elusimicrobia bacterium]|nr:prepilin-type N-terminal cleavage/methylation domain-containing protein [Elusimicrobiota bacterium]